jgi:hypothetical protein
MSGLYTARAAHLAVIASMIFGGALLSACGGADGGVLRAASTSVGSQTLAGSGNYAGTVSYFAPGASGWMNNLSVSMNIGDSALSMASSDFSFQSPFQAKLAPVMSTMYGCQHWVARTQRLSIPKFSNDRVCVDVDLCIDAAKQLYPMQSAILIKDCSISQDGTLTLNNVIFNSADLRKR